MYEHHRQPLLPLRRYLLRVLKHVGLSATLIGGSLLIGIIGYHGLAGLGWLDAFLNASMILSGMGPVDPLTTPMAKLFAGCYALFSGIVFIASAGLVMAPFLHRVLHRLKMCD